MSEAYKKLVKTLQTIFEMDKADLDFGIYRIMNQKREEINRFLEHDLLPQVKEAFADYAKGGKSEVQAELDQLINTLTEAGMDPEQSPKVKELREKAKASVDMVALENEVYSHLHTFFSRYYDKGDFISQRRYKKDTYAIPYEGEEVKLYWANQDQYYIKSSEHLRDYAFTVMDEQKNVRIKLVEADTEKDNVKAESGKERRFVLDADNPLSVENDELHIHFHYIPAGKKKQDALNKEAVDTLFKQQGFEEWMPLLKQKAPTESNPDRTLLEKHLNEYTARNTFDYFIHKDLGGFLRRELDFYIKNEVLYLDDIDDAAFAVTEQQLRKIKVIRTIAHKIIRMLAQIEDFQKKLWLKKKFVVETNYCITLDRVPEALYPQIVDNQAQHQEWVKLGFIEDKTSITEAYLKENPFLVLDTRFFDDDFKDTLLASFEGFDEQCDGILIESDNFHALRLLHNRYKKQITCCYIDPPYNTGKDGFLYKDAYKSSSWCSMLTNRLTAAKPILSNDALFFLSNDDNENDNLKKLLSINGYIFKTNLVWNTDGHTDNQFEIKVNHEYITLAQVSKNAKYGNVVDPNTRKESNLWKNIAENSITKNGPANPYSEVMLPAGFPVKGESGLIEAKIPPQEFFVELGDLSYFPRNLIKKHKISFPIKYNSASFNDFKLSESIKVCAGWANLNKLKKFIMNGCKPFYDEDGMLEFYLSEKGTIYYKKTKDAARNVVSVLRNFKTTEKMKYELEEMDIHFSYPKPTDLISYLSKIGDSNIYLDFFAGSGTTAQAIIDLIREDGRRRKYILIEMGNNFDAVIKPRITKVIYSENWKDGVPATLDSGISHCFKYIRLESYEDALNNLALKPRTKQQEDLLKHHAELREDYMLGYWLELETADSPSLLNIEQFEDPFNYKLNIATGSVGATKPTRVDLVETFNYLIGLTVKHIDTVRGFKVITGTNPKGESVLVIWRNLKEKDNAALEAFMDKSGYNPRDTEYEHIYVNGDHTLEDPHSKVKMIEIEFKRLMFDARDV